MIDKAGLPHPSWEFVRTYQDLKKFYRTKDYCGWTVRTIQIKGKAWHNLYANWVPKKDVPAMIERFQQQHNSHAKFVVYLSWKWVIMGTLFIDRSRVVLEAVKGSMVDLMRHGKIELHEEYAHGKLKFSQGNRALITPAQRRVVLSAAKKIKHKNIILEWSVPTRGKLIFYKVERISDAAKRLIEKYG